MDTFGITTNDEEDPLAPSFNMSICSLICRFHLMKWASTSAIPESKIFPNLLEFWFWSKEIQNWSKWKWNSDFRHQKFSGLIERQ